MAAHPMPEEPTPLGSRPKLTRDDVIGDHPVWHRSGTGVFPGRHDRRGKW